MSEQRVIPISEVIEELNSGRWARTAGRLRLHDRHCCVGVMCRMAGIPAESLSRRKVAPLDLAYEETQAFKARFPWAYSRDVVTERASSGGQSRLSELMDANDDMEEGDLSYSEPLGLLKQYLDADEVDDDHDE